MKTLYLIPLILVACTKEEPTPEPEMDLQIDQVHIEGIIPSFVSGQTYQIKGTTLDEVHQIEIDLGSQLQEFYIIDPEPIEGDQDPVYVRTSGYTYTLIDSAGFLVSLSEQNGLYEGSYQGLLHHPTQGYISINSTFRNL